MAFLDQAKAFYKRVIRLAEEAARRNVIWLNSTCYLWLFDDNTIKIMMYALLGNVLGTICWFNPYFYLIILHSDGIFMSIF